MRADEMNFNCPQKLKLIRRLNFFLCYWHGLVSYAGDETEISLRFNLIRRFAGFEMLEA